MDLSIGREYSRWIFLKGGNVLLYAKYRWNHSVSDMNEPNIFVAHFISSLDVRLPPSIPGAWSWAGAGAGLETIHYCRYNTIVNANVYANLSDPSLYEKYVVHHLHQHDKTWHDTTRHNMT